ncbi:hypothetical protein PR202_gb05830 [Eleusine coracana subsp. coracana]|uniref:Uncharacterized protein n=1 Tax=Eleusine coracana subsp. coracana TaxID=191504 RepID=A0AAV5E822_ELECO|nr:hypothetical protein PR202_gb05830 [Eleusine coracana subsp. coracana]
MVAVLDAAAAATGTVAEKKKEASTTSMLRSVTSSEMALHCTEGDLWVAVQGKPGRAGRHGRVRGVPPSLRVAALSDYAVSDVSRDYLRLVADFARAGLFDRKGHVCAFSLLAMAALLSGAVWLVLASSSVAAHMVAAVMLGFLWMQSGFLGHDSGHYAAMPTRALTFYPVMCLARANLFAQSFLLLLVDTHTRVPAGRVLELAGLAVFWAWYPWLVTRLPTSEERAAFVLLSFAVTGIQHVQFCLNHFSAGTYVGRPRGDDWFQKQTRGTLDVDCPPWMDWFYVVDLSTHGTSVWGSRAAALASNLAIRRFDWIPGVE